MYLDFIVRKINLCRKTRLKVLKLAKLAISAYDSPKVA